MTTTPVAEALDAVRLAPLAVDVLRLSDTLTTAAAGSARADTVALLASTLDGDDDLVAIAAIHALARVFDDEADAVLADLLWHERRFVREHAAWAFASRLPQLDVIGRLVRVVVDGGFSGMVAQRTLERWSWAASEHVGVAITGAIASCPDAEARARLVETLGLVPGDLATRALLRLLSEPDEIEPARAAAVAALGDRWTPDVHDLLDGLARGDGEVADAARLARFDHVLTTPARRLGGAGLRVAQLFLHADLDPGLARAGAADNGGVATLLVGLGDALVEHPEVAQVVTMGRGTAPDALRSLLGEPTRHHFAPVPLGPSVTQREAWPRRVVAERGIRRVLRALGPFDALHLRMADVGSLAGHAAARRMGLPTVFSLAPDPQALLHALDMAGDLPRDRFGEADEHEHFWFRARLVQRLAADADRLALFPRVHLRDELQELLGIDVAKAGRRATVVPEGIDLRPHQRAEQERTGTVVEPVVADLLAAIEVLPAERRGLPLVLTVGRLHRVKGVATVVRAWAGDVELASRCNLVVVGGDLAAPNLEEAEQLGQIASAASGAPDGLVLLGHRPNADVARLLATARHGHGNLVGADGAYVCGSLKEEFGLAVLEAMAAGLAVVAPQGSGPATYVEDDVTGLLVDTASAPAIAAGIRRALELAPVPGRAQRARAVVADRFTVQAMASTLVEVYGGVREPARS